MDLQEWFRKKRKKKEISLLKRALENRIFSIADLILVTGVSYANIKNYEKEGLVNLFWFKRGVRGRFERGKIGKNKGWFDAKIREFRGDKSYEVLVKEFEEEFGESITRAQVGNYIKESGQTEIFRKTRDWARQAEANEKLVEENVVNTLLEVVIQKAEQGGYGEAVRYYFGSKRRDISNLEKMSSRVKQYKEAKNRLGRDLFFTEVKNLFGTKRGGYAQSIEQLLRNMGLTKREKQTKRNTSLEKREAIRRVYDFDLHLSSVDIGYFLDICPAVVRNYLKRIGQRRRNFGIKRLYRSGVLTYRDAFQIYGFKEEFKASNEEIADAIGKPLYLVEYTLEHREEVEPKLVHALRVMFPKEEVTKGYK